MQLLLIILVLALFYQVTHFTWEPFVASNDYEVSDLTSEEWSSISSLFQNMVQIVNGSNYSISNDLQELISKFTEVLNSTGLGRFSVVSIGTTSPFTMKDVLIRETTTGQQVKLERVDFVLDSKDLTKIGKIILTPTLNSTSLIGTYSKQDSQFKLENPLYLFYPYATSDNDMKKTS